MVQVIPKELKATAKLNNTVPEEAINIFEVPQGLILGALLCYNKNKLHAKNMGKMQSCIVPW